MTAPVGDPWAAQPTSGPRLQHVPLTMYVKVLIGLVPLVFAGGVARAVDVRHHNSQTAAARPLASLPPTPPLGQDAAVTDDLRSREVVFNPARATQDTAAAHTGPLGLDAFVADLPASDQAANKKDLTNEGFQGALAGQWLSQSGSKVRDYFVTLVRFDSAAGAASHFTNITTGPIAKLSRLGAVSPDSPNVVEFRGTTSTGDRSEDIAFIVNGNYFAQVQANGPKGDTGNVTDEALLIRLIAQTLG